MGNGAVTHNRVWLPTVASGRGGDIFTLRLPFSSVAGSFQTLEIPGRPALLFFFLLADHPYPSSLTIEGSSDSRWLLPLYR